MKASIKILAASLLFISSISFAGNGERAFRKKINKFIHYPFNISKKVDATVYVEFTVQENLEIRIDSFLCDNEEISSDIIRQLKKITIDIDKADVINKTFYYKFSLEVEK